MTLETYRASLFRPCGDVLVIFALVVLLTTGCVKTKYYEGPRLPATEVAIIKGSSHFNTQGNNPRDPLPVNQHNTFLEKIDDNGTFYSNKEVHVLPGQHIVKVRYTITEYSFWRTYFLGRSPGYKYLSKLQINFLAEAGHVYLIAVERRREKDWIWVVDMASNKVVAGETPPS